jgi:hypothetical protein
MNEGKSPSFSMSFGLAGTQNGKAETAELTVEFSK